MLLINCKVGSRWNIRTCYKNKIRWQRNFNTNKFYVTGIQKVVEVTAISRAQAKNRISFKIATIK